VRLWLSGDETSEREEREVADAELPGRLEGIGWREREGPREEVWGAWDGRAEMRKEDENEKYKGIDFLRRSCPVLSPTVKSKLCV